MDANLELNGSGGILFQDAFRPIPNHFHFRLVALGK